MKRRWALRKTWTYGTIGDHIPPEIVQRLWTQRGAIRRCRVLQWAAGDTRFFEVIRA